MKKLMCLLAAMALAGVAGASVVVVDNGAYQNGWGTNFNMDAPQRFEPGTGPGGVPAVVTSIPDGSQSDMGEPGPQANITGNQYLEYLIYFNTASGGTTHSGQMLISLNGSNPWGTYLYNQPAVTITDMATGTSSAVTMETSGALGSDKWMHVKVDLAQALGWGGYTPPALTAGHIILCAFPGSSMNAAISDMRFSATGTELLIPEPATIALLGLGGLALIRRKR